MKRITTGFISVLVFFSFLLTASWKKTVEWDPRKRPAGNDLLALDFLTKKR